MENNKLNKELDSIIKTYSNAGFVIVETNSKSIILSKAVLVDPTQGKGLARIERVKITQNPDYETFMAEAHEYPIENRPQISAFNVNYEIFEAELGSSEINAAENNILRNSVAYKVTHKTEQPQAEPTEPGSNE